MLVSFLRTGFVVLPAKNWQGAPEIGLQRLGECVMFEGPIEDRLAIRERIEAYGDAVFRRDAEDWIANWSDDAVWRLPGLELRGKPDMKAAWIQAMAGFTVAGFFAMPGAIQVDGAVATARAYTREVLVGHDGKVTKIIGVYDDKLIKDRGTWLFAERAYTVLHAEAPA